MSLPKNLQINATGVNAPKNKIPNTSGLVTLPTSNPNECQASLRVSSEPGAKNDAENMIKDKIKRGITSKGDTASPRHNRIAITKKMVPHKIPKLFGEKLRFNLLP